jgi:hypothetical protein
MTIPNVKDSIGKAKNKHNDNTDRQDSIEKAKNKNNDNTDRQREHPVLSLFLFFAFSMLS